MKAELLDVIAVRSNPIRWERPHQIALEWIQHMLDSGVKLTVAEVAYGERPFQYADIPHINHIPLRAKTWAWSKENLLNIAIARLPEARYICWHDSDVFHEKSNWASETVHGLQHYTVLQPWDTALDRGPDGEVMQVHKSFCSLFHAGKPVIPTSNKFWTFQGGPYTHGHPGFCWAATRQFFDWVGGLLEVCAMGSADWVMACSLLGSVKITYPGQVSESYQHILNLWQERAVQHVNRSIGYVPGVVNHSFHGPKGSGNSKVGRGYESRWQMFLDHGFDPLTDLKKNSNGVIEFAGNKPELEREFDLYLRNRQEDSNQAG